MVPPPRPGGLPRPVQQLLGFVLRQEGRQPPDLPRTPDLARGIVLDHAPAREKPEAAPDAGEPAGDGGLREPALVKPGQIAADQPRVSVGQRRALAAEEPRELAEVGGV